MIYAMHRRTSQHRARAGLTISVAFLLLAFLSLSARGQGSVDLGAGRQPQVAASPAGDIFVAFGRDNGIYFTASRDGGHTFSSAVNVATVKSLALGMRRGPRIVAMKDALLITAIAGETGKGRDGDVLAWRSTDGGATWSALASPINDVADSAREGLHNLGDDPARGRVFCVWLDLR